MRNKLILDSAQRHVPSAFKQGKSMSEQLREERMRIEKSAISRRATAAEVGAPKVFKKRDNMPYTAFSIKLKNELGDKVRQFAKVQKITASEFVRQAVKAYINQLGGEA